MEAEDLGLIEIRNYLLEYIQNKIGLLIFSILILPAGFYLFYLDSDAFSTVSTIKFGFVFPIQVLFFLPIICIRAKKIFLVILDLKSGCKTKNMVVQILTQNVEMTLFESEKYKKENNIDRYSTWKAKSDSHKNIHLIKDEKVCDYRIVRGNVHTVQVLYYSNFLLKAKVGKDKK